MSPLNALAVAFVASCIIINPARGLTEGGLNDTSVPANVPAESPAATADWRAAQGRRARAHLPPVRITWDLGRAGREKDLERAFREQDEGVVTGWATDGSGYTLLMSASGAQPSPSSARFLLDNNADPNKVGGWNAQAKEQRNVTALHLCSMHGTAKHLAIARDLVRYGADLHAKNAGGETPLDLARKYGLTEMVKLLEELAADPVYRCRFSDLNHPFCITWELGAAGREKDLERAFREQDEGVVTGWATDGSGYTLLMSASNSQPSPSSAKFLLDNNADPNKVGPGNMTALHFCAYGGTAKHLAIARDLVLHGADVHAKDNSGKTPLDIVRMNDRPSKLHEEMIKLLEELAAVAAGAASAGSDSCRCRSDHACVQTTHHTDWCYLASMDACSDAVQGEGGPWSETPCQTEGGLNDTSVPANVTAESPAADECKDASDAEIRAQLPVESEDNICEALGSIHACDHPELGERVKQVCPRTCNMCGCGGASTLASASNGDDDQVAGYHAGYSLWGSWWQGYYARLRARKPTGWMWSFRTNSTRQ